MTQPSMDCSGEVDAFLASDLPDLEKLARAFGCITGLVVDHARKEIDLARALNDREQTIKIQIKRDSIVHARDIFAMCYLRVTGRKPWDDTD